MLIAEKEENGKENDWAKDNLVPVSVPVSVADLFRVNGIFKSGTETATGTVGALGA